MRLLLAKIVAAAIGAVALILAMLFAAVQNG